MAYVAQAEGAAPVASALEILVTDALLLDAALLEAHAQGNTAELVRLYTLAAENALAAGDVHAADFYLTHAFIFALEKGGPEAGVLNIRLAERGRMKLLDF